MADEPAIARRERLFESLAQAPWAHDFYAVLRRVEALAPDAPRLGKALRPAAEPLRLGQDPELDFAPAALSSFAREPGRRGARPPRLGVRFFGLFGPMGPLPLHLTEYARDRLRQHDDPTFARLADVFHHRALLLFYRAWAESQPAVAADRPADDAFARWVGALFGQAPAALHGIDAVPDPARRFVAAHLGRATRNVESIEKVLSLYFEVPIRVQERVGHWLPLRPRDRSHLGASGARRTCALGCNAVLGERAWDRQYRLRLHVGPLTLAQYRRFLPGRPALRELRDWMRQLLGFEMLWDLRLVLREDEVPPLALARAADPVPRLGHAAWLGGARRTGDRGDLLLPPARLGALSSHPGDRHA